MPPDQRHIAGLAFWLSFESMLNSQPDENEKTEGSRCLGSIGQPCQWTKGVDLAASETHQFARVS